MEKEDTGKDSEQTLVCRGDDFVEWLKRAGLPTEQVKRIIIDLTVGEVAMIYIEKFCSTKILKVQSPDLSKGTEIVVLDKEATSEKDEK